MMTWTSEEIRQHALKIGFDVCRVVSLPEVWAAQDRLRAFVDAGYHGQMTWMEETLERRSHPNAMWAEARSAIVIGQNYGPDYNPLETLSDKERAAISVYASGRDYHDVLKKRLKALARDYVAASGTEVKVFVDTAPLMEKPLTEHAGLGWQGKHTNLVSREFGSWLFLGVMLTTAELSPNEPEQDHCGSCSACLDICPTDAFPAPYQLDARKCISYLTIEHDGRIPPEFRKAIGNRVYGCDDCLAVCPWNKFASEAQEAKFAAEAHTRAPRLADLLIMDEETFRSVYSGSPIKRIKHHRFLRNVLIAVGNSNDRSLIPAVLDRLDDPHPLIRGTAVWALGQLAPDQFSREKSVRLPSETDEGVLAEWKSDF